jgi:predicted TIM-barrel fold metal-dependent hydrolase
LLPDGVLESMIVEWNHHLWSRDTDSYPFHPDARYHPHPDKRSDSPLADYERRMDRHGIDRAVLVQPEPYGDDHSLLLECVSRAPSRFRATSLFYPGDPDAPAKLERLVAEHGDLVIATRFHSDEYYMDGFADDGVQALWEAASELGLIVELHLTPPYAEGAGRLVRDYPETPVVMDHLAEPQDGNAVEYAHVLDLAQYDNVYMKLSGLNHFSNDPPLHESVRPFTRRVIDAFGPERLLWGYGTPQIVDVHMDGYTEDERELVKGDNAYELGWTE